MKSKVVQVILIAALCMMISTESTAGLRTLLTRTQVPREAIAKKLFLASGVAIVSCYAGIEYRSWEYAKRVLETADITVDLEVSRLEKCIATGAFIGVAGLGCSWALLFPRSTALVFAGLYTQRYLGQKKIERVIPLSKAKKKERLKEVIEERATEL